MLRKFVARHGGTVQGDGCGGLEILAPPDRKWVNGEVQCLVLPLSEYDRPGEREAEIQTAIDMVSDGHEPY